MAAGFLLISAGCRDGMSHDSAPPIVVKPAAESDPPNSQTALRTAPQAFPGMLPPLRRTPQTSVGEFEDSAADTIDWRTDIVTFKAIKSPAGMTISARSLVPSDERIQQMLTPLQALGFKADGDAGSPAWTCVVSADGRPAFETRLAAELKSCVERIENMRRRLRCCRPGRVLWSRADAPQNPGAGSSLSPQRLVYTGQQMDFAFADSSEPQWFVAVKPAGSSMGLLRGGRISVSEEGTIQIEGYAPAGELAAAPRDTVQLIIDPAGRLTALRREAATQELGRLPLVKLARLQDVKFTITDDGLIKPDDAAAAVPQSEASEGPIRAGHLEYPAPDRLSESRRLAAEIALRNALESLSVSFENPMSAAAAPGEEPLVIFADAPWAERHLKALGINVDRGAGRLVILGDRPRVSAALTRVLQVLRLRMSLQEQNLRNAERIRDADNRLNPYRRKTLSLDDKGEVAEGEDPAPFPKTFKPGDPNADADGFIVLPNVNRAVETAEFQAAREEYKLIKAAAERLEPRSIFPDPPQIMP